MSRRLYFLLVLSIYSTLAIAQDDFREGFIVRAANDTLHGFINYHENRSNFHACEFKKDLKETAVTTYQPGQIFGYGFKKERHYLSKDVPLPDSTNKKVFLEVLVNGRITLFKLKEQGYFDLFYIEKDESFYLVNNGLPRKQGESRKQLGILNYTMYDCPSVARKTADVDPDERSLVKITEAYNTCMGGASTTYKESKKWMAFSPHLAAGVAYSTLNVTVAGSEPYEGKYESHIGAFFGFGFDISLPRSRERLVLHLASVVMPTNYSKTKYVYYSTTVDLRYDYTLKSTQLKFPIGLKYIFPGKNFRTFMNGGVSFTSNLNSTSTATRRTVYNNVVLTPAKIDAPVTVDSFTGYWIGLGGAIPVHKKFDLYTEIRYEYTNGMVFLEGGASSKIHNIYGVLGIRF